MNACGRPISLKYSPPNFSHDRVLAGGVSGFQPESVNPVNELEFTVSSLENLPSQSVFFQKQSSESIPERVSERFIAGPPPSLLWSAPNLNPNGVSGQLVQGGGSEPSPSLGQNQSVRLSAWLENPLSSPVVCGGKKGALRLKNCLEKPQSSQFSRSGICWKLSSKRTLLERKT